MPERYKLTGSSRVIRTESNPAAEGQGPGLKGLVWLPRDSKVPGIEIDEHGEVLSADVAAFEAAQAQANEIVGNKED